MSRTAPEADPIETERRAALLSLDVARVRAWAATYDVPLLPADNALLLRSIHQARAQDPTFPPSARALSRRWLKAHRE